MRPLKLTLEGIKSFDEEQTVDFTALGKSNIFVICGVTGAGKSTVLDSIILALYGNKKDGLKIEQYINLKSDKGIITLDFEAESGGVKKNYRVTRTLFRSSRANKATLTDLDTGVVLCDGGDKVSAYIQEMIGLSVTNFTNVIVLEQGKYSEFLKATKKERNEVVGSLFKLEKYRDLYGRAGAKKKAVDFETAALDEYLSSVKDVTAAGIEESRRKIKAAGKREKELEERALELAKKRERFAADEQAYRHYVEALAASQAAKKEFDSRAAALEDFEKGASDRKSDEEKLASLSEKVTLAREKTTALEKLKDTVDSLSKAERELGDLRDDYGKKYKKLKLAKEDKLRTEGVGKLHAENFGKHCDALSDFGIELSRGASVADVQKVIGEYKLAHSASALAESLKEGDTCPVCGSRVTGRHRHISDEEFRRVLKLLEEAAFAAELCENGRQNLIKRSGEIDTLSAELDGLKNVGTARSAEVESLKKQTESILGDSPYELAVKTAGQELKALEERHAAFKKELDERELTRARLTAEKARAEGILKNCLESEKKLRCAEPDKAEAESCRAEAEAVEKERRELASAVTLCADKIEREEKELAVKREKEKKRKELSACADNLAMLMKMFKGDKFLEFVSQEYILDFCTDASQTLSNMSGGCYTMGYDTENAEFYVCDFRAGNLSRSVGTLSGGETFLASLSLAIAVSKSIAEKNASGLKFDFLFLDEGFGTLHKDAIGVVERALRLLSRDTLVGIVTHRSELSELIPDRLYVESATESTGSRVRIES